MVRRSWDLHLSFTHLWELKETVAEFLGPKAQFWRLLHWLFFFSIVWGFCFVLFCLLCARSLLVWFLLLLLLLVVCEIEPWYVIQGVTSPCLGFLGVGIQRRIRSHTILTLCFLMFGHQLMSSFLLFPSLTPLSLSKSFLRLNARSCIAYTYTAMSLSDWVSLDLTTGKQDGTLVGLDGTVLV